ncbi:MAG: MarR family transcriptional regulator [Acidimicrobiales bacterium]|nr:MarR family transcriptional regulator [Acidimicrobiales bacterium]MCS5676203.1 MarR family transcriptional regulator [Acidimicrobiales bacterium]MDG2906233.1 MarR family transcriptional regulator [Acidimicrobiales bacterium]
MPPTSGQDPTSGDVPQVVAAARAAAKLARQVTIPLGEVDLSLPQYRVLAFLEEGEAAPSDLAGRLSVSRPSITALMDGLITRGLVERRPDTDDGRRVHHHLTDDGRNVLQRADQAVGDRLVAIGTHVNAGDPSVLIASLARFGQAIRAARAAGTT